MAVRFQSLGQLNARRRGLNARVGVPGASESLGSLDHQWHIWLQYLAWILQQFKPSDAVAFCTVTVSLSTWSVFSSDVSMSPLKKQNIFTVWKTVQTMKKSGSRCSEIFQNATCNVLTLPHIPLSDQVCEIYKMTPPKLAHVSGSDLIIYMLKTLNNLILLEDQRKCDALDRRVTCHIAQ